MEKVLGKSDIRTFKDKIDLKQYLVGPKKMPGAAINEI